MPDRAIRDIAIDAACLLVQEGRAGSITFAEIADAAEVDEAALRGVFPSLDDLLVAVADRTYAAFLAEVDAEVGDDESDGAYARAYVRASVRTTERDGFATLVAALLASAPYRPHFTDGVREQEATVRCALEADGVDPVIAHIARLAADGLWFSDVFGLNPVSLERRRQIVDRLQVLIAHARQSATAAE